MQTSRTQGANAFPGDFNSHGGPQYLGNQFNSGGGPMYIDSNSEDDKLPTTTCELPDFIRTPTFTGRGDELQQIDRAFSTSSSGLPARCIIHGMPGLGKTQLALKFATSAFERSQYAYVFWISAASVETLSRDFSKLVDLLRLPGRHTSDQATKLTMARAWLEDPTHARSWLVILDNVNQETTTTLRDMLPRRNGGGKLLFTTRTAKIAEVLATSGGQSRLALQPPGIQDAVAMLLARIALERDGTSEVSYADVKEVVRLVGALPLAIDQAASYIRETGSSLNELLQIYKTEEKYELLEWENDLSRHEEKSVAAIFTPALNKIRGTAPDALTLLRVFCFCNPESIQISIFTQGCGALHQERRPDGPPARAPDKLEAVIDLFLSQVRLSKAIQEVQRLSLATCALEGTERTIRIHDLVQFILRSRLMTETGRESWLEAAIHVICKAFGEVGDYRSPQNWNRCGQFVSHVEFLETFAEQYEFKTTELLKANTSAAIYLLACGFYQKAAVLNGRTVDKKKVALGEEHPSTLYSMAELADSYARQGRWKEAEKLGVRVLEIRTKLLGQEHPETLISIGNLASTYRNQGRWKKAEELGVQVTEIQQRVLGEEHPKTLTSISNLALIYKNQGRWKEAEKLGVQGIETRTRVLGQEHPETLISIGNLASIYRNQGRWKEAEKLEVQVIETRTRVLGEEHPETLTSIGNLASTYGNQGRWKEAEELQVQVIKTRTRVLGQEHPGTLISIGNLALTYGDQGRWKGAEKLEVQVMETKQRVLGQEHPSTLTSIGNLASTYGNQGRWKEAEELEVQVIETRTRVLGQEHPDTLTSMNNLAFIIKSQGRNDQAIGLMRRCVELRKQVLGLDHPRTKASLGCLQKWQDEEQEVETSRLADLTIT